MQLMNIRYKTVEDFYEDEFPGVIIDWVLNTNDLRYRMNFEEVDFTGHQIYTDGHKELTIVEYKEANTIAALHKDSDALGVEWLLSIVFKPNSHELFIRMSNSKSTEDGKFMSNFRKPDIIDELVDLKILDMDYDIEMSYKPHDVKKSETQEFLSVINRTAKFTLPVIYLALGPYNTYGADPDKLANIYAGMAHVFVQEHKNCFDELINGTDKYIPKNGEIAIYFSNENLKEVHLAYNKYDEKSMEKAISKSIHFFYHNQNFGPLTTYEEIASAAISIRNHKLKEENTEVYKENARVEKENSDIVNTFDYDLKKSDEEIEKLKKKVNELEIENQILRKRVESSESAPLLFYGLENELYTGEIKEILMNILENVNVNEGSRRQHIINDLLKANVIKPTIKDRHASLKQTLSEYREMTPDIRKGLEELGFSISSDGKHHKLVYRGDNRYQITIPKTSSDYRSGLNAATYIIKNMM